MELKIVLKWSLVVFCAAAIFFIIFSIFKFHGWDFYTKPTSAANTQALQDPSMEAPIRLTIPKIGVDATIEDVGLTSQGAMAAPEGPVDVAWFDLGPRPGESGSAVIAGHEGWKDGIPAAFDDLYKLQKGDQVYVTNKQGAIITFVVRGIQTFDQNGDASDIFSSNDGAAHLNLITCEGTWNAAQQSYSNRLVVFTDEEKE
jgi:LPXTG-site transpeptidase (sortase) family protein